MTDWPITHVEADEMNADVADLSDHTKLTHVTDADFLTDADFRSGVGLPLENRTLKLQIKNFDQLHLFKLYKYL